MEVNTVRNNSPPKVENCYFWGSETTTFSRIKNFKLFTYTSWIIMIQLYKIDAELKMSSDRP